MFSEMRKKKSKKGEKNWEWVGREKRQFHLEFKGGKLGTEPLLVSIFWGKWEAVALARSLGSRAEHNARAGGSCHREREFTRSYRELSCLSEQEQSQGGQDYDTHLSKSAKTRVRWEFLAMESRQEMKQ